MEEAKIIPKMITIDGRQGSTIGPSTIDIGLQKEGERYVMSLVVKTANMENQVTILLDPEQIYALSFHCSTAMMCHTTNILNDNIALQSENKLVGKAKQALTDAEDRASKATNKLEALLRLVKGYTQGRFFGAYNAFNALKQFASEPQEPEGTHRIYNCPQQFFDSRVCPVDFMTGKRYSCNECRRKFTK